MDKVPVVFTLAEQRRYYDADYYMEHREERLAQIAKYDAEHREEKRSYNAKYHAMHHEELRAKQANYNTAHREEQRAYSAQYRAEHPTYATKYRVEHLEASRSYTTNRTHKKRANGGSFSRAAWEHLKTLFGHCCAYCKRRMERLTQDHVIPISKGGWHFSGNIVPACRSCNSLKHTRIYASPVKGGLRYN
jgi:5-methylcytosine-specific restriction endonuclease McrA